LLNFGSPAGSDPARRIPFPREKGYNQTRTDACEAEPATNGEEGIRMRDDCMHPADRIMDIIGRIFRHGLSTARGLCLSIREDNGYIWITPAGTDKGALTRRDMLCVRPDGSVIGIRPPDGELPIHRLVYAARPDLKAIVSAHPPALAAWSLVRQTPDARLLPYESGICGEIGTAPDSGRFGLGIADAFAKGCHAVMPENRGVVTGGKDLSGAFRVFETVEFLGRLELTARRIGRPVPVPTEAIGPALRAASGEPDARFMTCACNPEETAVRREMCAFIRRLYDQRLLAGAGSACSRRLEDGAFVITSDGMDPGEPRPGDLVRIGRGAAEEGKAPSRSWRLHERIYARQPHVKAIILAQPPNLMAFAVTDAEPDVRVVPESRILPRQMPKLPFGAVFEHPDETAAVFGMDAPIAIVRNHCVVATGAGLPEAFDRLEAAECAARAFIDAHDIGGAAPAKRG
jgi:L-fuculose-phosphate aldolase